MTTMALWSGRFAGDTHGLVGKFSASLGYDRRLYPYDIQGSIAHARMLGATGIIPPADAAALVKALGEVRAALDRGEFPFDERLEDIHMSIEAALIRKLGEAGARLHTGRSRNDQVATDERLLLRAEADALTGRLVGLQQSLVRQAAAHTRTILPGFTHLQHAQPVVFGHHLLAYVEMLERDKGRLAVCRHRLNVCPLGSGALAGSTLPLDRERVAAELEFDGVTRNSMDAVADRDHLVEFLAALALIAMHTSRLAEDCVLWMSPEFGFVEFDDAFCTGSSLMPQKKNPDVAELTRGKAGRVYGSLIGLLTVLKGLPLTYNRDLQEDKEGLFDAIDTVAAVLDVLAPMMDSATVRVERMRAAAADPGLMATDLAEWLVGQGVAFRDAHHQVGRFVGDCVRRGIGLDLATLAQMREHIPLATEECLKLFSPERSVAARDLPGGTAPAQVERQVAFWQKRLA